MRQGPRTPIAALAALLLAFGLVACGGDEDPDTATTGAAQEQARGGNGSSGGDDRDGKGGSGEGQSTGAAPEEPAGGFQPRQHDDSGGGSEQFRVRGGDNSVQEFGSEAGEGDFEQAAAALHNFLDARAQGAWAAACDYLSTGIVESLRKLAVPGEEGQDTGCAALLARLTNRAALPALRREARRADVGSLRVEGERAFLIYRGLEGTIMAMSMSEEGGEWKVASLAGVPLN